jgi:predicted nucleic acid-binding protein
MAEVVLDANVIVALLYSSDALHQRARNLAERLETEGHAVVLVDFLVLEALSVLCRRAVERKTTPPDLDAALAVIRGWFDVGEVRFLAKEADRLAGDILDVVSDTKGALNSNDALIVVLAREGAIEMLASFDERFDGLDRVYRTS